MEHKETISALVLTSSFRKGRRFVQPTHQLVKNWVFDEQDEDEALFAQTMAVIAEKSDISTNELSHIYPAILRMLKNKSEWAK